MSKERVVTARSTSSPVSPGLPAHRAQEVRQGPVRDLTLPWAFRSSRRCRSRRPGSRPRPRRSGSPRSPWRSASQPVSRQIASGACSGRSSRSRCWVSSTGASASSSMKARRSVGVGRVQRHVGPARLEDAQQPHHHLQRALDADAHQDLRSHAQRAQVVRELVGARVELPVGELLVLEDHRDRVGRALDLLLEQLVDAPIPRILCCRVVPLEEQLVPLRLAQQRQLGEALIGICRRCLLAGASGGVPASARPCLRRTGRRYRRT